MAEVGAGKAVNLSLVTVSGSRMVQRNERPGDLVEGERAEASARTVPVLQLSPRHLSGKLRASAAKERGLGSLLLPPASRPFVHSTHYNCFANPLAANQ